MSFMSKVDRRSDANQQKGSHVHTMKQREDRKGHSKHQAHQNRSEAELSRSSPEQRVSKAER